MQSDVSTGMQNSDVSNVQQSNEVEEFEEVRGHFGYLDSDIGHSPKYTAEFMKWRDEIRSQISNNCLLSSGEFTRRHSDELKPTLSKNFM